jgi:hypothetical protein
MTKEFPPDQISYKVSIEEISSKVKSVWSREKLADTGGKDGGAEYGDYYHDEMVPDRTEIYEQLVDDLDIEAVIRAVNGIRRRTKTGGE